MAYVDTEKIPFKIIPYNFNDSAWKWSESLDDILLGFNFVIVQTTAGAGFLNCSVLPKQVNLIVDGWVPLLAELPSVLLSYHRIYRKTFWSKTFMPQYEDLIRRANCILYASDRQHYYYEGQFFMMQKLDWSSFKFSPLLKVPYGIDKENIIERNVNPDEPLKLLWYGPVYPWYNPEIIIEELKNNPNITVDFIGAVHPRYRRIYSVYYKRLFEEAKKYPNFRMIEDYCDNSTELFSKYDAGIVLAKNWLEEKYSYRCRILEMVSKGFPVIINTDNTLCEEFPFLSNMLLSVSQTNLVESLESIRTNKKLMLECDAGVIDELHEILNWENVLQPLIGYIKRF